MSGLNFALVNELLMYYTNSQSVTENILHFKKEISAYSNHFRLFLHFTTTTTLPTNESIVTNYKKREIFSNPTKEQAFWSLKKIHEQ